MYRYKLIAKKTIIILIIIIAVLLMLQAGKIDTDYIKGV
jgi:hypothetical protein